MLGRPAGPPMMGNPLLDFFAQASKAIKENTKKITKPGAAKPPVATKKTENKKKEEPKKKDEHKKDAPKKEEHKKEETKTNTKPIKIE